MELCAASDPYCAFRNVFWPVRGNAGKPNWSATHSAVIQSGSLSMNHGHVLVAVARSNRASKCRVGEQVLPVRNRRDAARVAGRSRRLDQLPCGREVVDARLRVGEVQRHHQVATHQQVPTQPADVRAFNREVVAEIASDDDVEGVGVRAS